MQNGQQAETAPLTVGRMCALVALVASAVRGLYLWQIYHAPFFDSRFGDGLVYHEWARQLAGGDWIGKDVFYQAPLYPYVLAVVYSFCGDSVLVVRLMHVCMGSASCVFLALATRYFFGSRAGLISGMALALFAPAVFLEGLIQKTALGTLLTTALLAVLASVSRRPRVFKWLAAGALLGLLSLTRENAVVFGPAILLWMLLLVDPQSWPRRLAWIGALLLGLAVVLGPVALRNQHLGGGWHLTTSQFGSNFYIGNHRGADGTYAPLAFDRGDAHYERRDATQLAERTLGRSLTPAEVSRYWMKRTLQDIGDDRNRWLRLLGWKLALLFNAAEIPDTEDQQVYADWSILLWILSYVFHFGVLLPVAVFGIIVVGPWRQHRLLTLLITCYGVSVVLFFVFARYRFPLAVLLMPVAAAGLLAAKKRLAAGQHRRLVVAAAIAVLTAVGSNLPIYDMAPNRALSYANIAVALSRDPSRRTEAISFYEQALDAKPDYTKVRNDYGALLSMLGRPAEAIGHLQEAVRQRPDYTAAHYNLGVALERLGELEAATAQYSRTLQIDPHHADAHNALGFRLAQARSFEKAIDRYRQAIAEDPSHAVAFNNLGVALAEMGRTAEAAECFARALDLSPNYVKARENLERARRLLGTGEQEGEAGSRR